MVTVESRTQFAGQQTKYLEGGKKHVWVDFTPLNVFPILKKYKIILKPDIL